MKLVLELMGNVVGDGLSVKAGPLATGLTQTAARRAQVGARTAQVHIHIVGQFIEYGLQFIGDSAKQDDVSGGAMHVGETTAAFFPDVAKPSEDVGSVEFTRRLVDTHGVKVGHFWEEVRPVAIAADDASTITQHAHDAAVLPVSFFVHVGLFEQA